MTDWGAILGLRALWSLPENCRTVSLKVGSLVGTLGHAGAHDPGVKSRVVGCIYSCHAGDTAAITHIDCCCVSACCDTVMWSVGGQALSTQQATNLASLMTSCRT